jgi:hypothetical protein
VVVAVALRGFDFEGGGVIGSESGCGFAGGGGGNGS